MAIRYFDPKNFTILLAGRPIEGYDLDFISVETDYDRYSLVQGIDGDAARVRNKLRSGTITLRLLQSTPTNNLLSYITWIDEFIGLGVLPFVAKERGLGGTTIISPSTFISKIPDPDFGTTPKTREWVLKSDNIFIFLAGLPRDDGSITTVEEFLNKINPLNSKLIPREDGRPF